MAGDRIQVDYDQLQDVAKRFQQQAEQHEALLQHLRQQVDPGQPMS